MILYHTILHSIIQLYHVLHYGGTVEKNTDQEVQCSAAQSSTVRMGQHNMLEIAVYTVSDCTMKHYANTLLCYGMISDAMPCYVMLGSAMQNADMLCNTIMNDAILCHAIA